MLDSMRRHPSELARNIESSMRILDQSGVSHTKSALSEQPQGFHRGLLRTLLLADDNLPRRVASTRTIIPLTFSDTAFSRTRQAGENFCALRTLCSAFPF